RRRLCLISYLPGRGPREAANSTLLLLINLGRAYNIDMARSWESKSVEDQIESAAAGKQVTARAPTLSAGEIQLMRAKENLELSRTRVTRELAASANPRYQELLRKA